MVPKFSSRKSSVSPMKFLFKILEELKSKNNKKKNKNWIKRSGTEKNRTERLRR